MHDNFCKEICTKGLGWNKQKRKKCRENTPCVAFINKNVPEVPCEKHRKD